MYFDHFPLVLHEYYTSKGESVLALMRDITLNVRVRKEVLQNITLYETYLLRDGETAEVVAEKVYGSPAYNWVVMILNEKYDYATDFPMDQKTLDDYITKKYTEEYKFTTHHWEDVNGYIVSSDIPTASSVSNYQYEDRLNEKKREIKLIDPSLLTTLMNNFNGIMNP